MHEIRPNQRSRGSSELGASWLTISVFLVIIGSIVFCAYKIIPFYYYYFEMQNQMEQIIQIAGTETDQEIRKKLEYHMKSLQLPVKPDALKIAREGKTIKVSLHYTEVFYIHFNGKDYDLHEFKFHAFASGPF